MSISQTPTYNIKVVLNQTGIAADTLRAWERRYGLPVPQRTQGGHRMYSERDIETIVWENPIRFFSTGGRLDRGDLESAAAVDQRELWQGNSVLRGQEPRVGR